MCAVECACDVVKLLVDPSNSSYVIALGADGEVRGAPRALS